MSRRFSSWKIVFLCVFLCCFPFFGGNIFNPLKIIQYQFFSVWKPFEDRLIISKPILGSCGTRKPSRKPSRNVPVFAWTLIPIRRARFGARTHPQLEPQFASGHARWARSWTVMDSCQNVLVWWTSQGHTHHNQTFMWVKTMPFLPPINDPWLGMIEITPMKMVMTGGWFVVVLPTLFWLFVGYCWFRSLVGSARNDGWHENRAQKRTIRGQQTYVLVQEMLLQHIKPWKTIMKHHEQLMKSHISLLKSTWNPP